MKRKRFSQTSMVLGITGMLAVSMLFGACSGLIQDDASTAPTADESALIQEYGAVVRIPISDLTDRAATAGTDIGFFGTTSLASNENFVTYYEAIFKNGTNYYTGRASVGQEYLSVGVPAGSYTVLVLAGTPANNDPSNGEKVLLGSGLRETVTIVGNQVNVVKVKMYGLGVKMGVSGMPKGTTTGTSGTVTINTSDKAMRFVQLEKAIPVNGNYNTTTNPWYHNTAFNALEIQVKLEQITPLHKALQATAISGNPLANLIGSGKLFDSATAQIVPLSYSSYTMEPISLPMQTSSNSSVPGTLSTADPPVFGTSSTLTLDYKIDSGTGTTTNIPNNDAIGNFYFNLRYIPYSQATPPAGSSTWNIRNRILWDGEGYYGGGVIFLFGDTAITQVIVEPVW